MKQDISIIVAISDNLAIGKENKLLWHISEDLRYFKKITKGHTVIMGRRTYESIGKALPERRNIIISRNMRYESGNIEIFSDIKSAIEAAKDDKIFIIGGGEIYRQTLAIANRLYMTLVHTTITDADTFFPAIDQKDWNEVYRESYKHGEKYPTPFEFIVLERK